MLPWRASIDYSAFPHLGHEGHELLISAFTHWSIDHSDLIVLQFGKQEVEQIGAAYGIDQHSAHVLRATGHTPCRCQATDPNANHARPKHLEQRFGVGIVAAQIGDNERIGIVLAINPRERAGTRSSIESCGSSLELANAEQPRLEGTVSADDSGRTILTAPHIMCMMRGLKQGQSWHHPD